MVNNSPTTEKGIFTVGVRSNRQIGPSFYKLLLECTNQAANALAEIRPGQFVQLDLTGAALPKPNRIPEELADSANRHILLRRPFSFSDLTVKTNVTFAEILYYVAGPATLRMTTLSPGQTVSFIGPLGNGFSIPEGKKLALLVTGGLGAGPLEHLAKLLTEDHPHINVLAFAGAKSADKLPFENKTDEISANLGFTIPEFAKLGIESRVATDDGSTGFHGTVTDCLRDWINNNQFNGAECIMYACGPEAMLAETASIAEQKNIQCMVSMERMMACGFGVCQSCAVECRTERQNQTVYKLCCKDGPVFNSREVIFKKS